MKNIRLLSLLLCLFPAFLSAGTPTDSLLAKAWYYFPFTTEEDLDLRALLSKDRFQPEVSLGYYEAYLQKNTMDKLEAEDKHALAFLYYYLEDYANATDLYESILNTESSFQLENKPNTSVDSLAFIKYNSRYYLAKANLKLDKPEEALKQINAIDSLYTGYYSENSGRSREFSKLNILKTDYYLMVNRVDDALALWTPFMSKGYDLNNEYILYILDIKYGFKKVKKEIHRANKKKQEDNNFIYLDLKFLPEHLKIRKTPNIKADQLKNNKLTGRYF